MRGWGMSKDTNSKDEKEVKKILLLGLDNSGKSSILLILTRKSNLLNFLQLPPTHKINRLNYEDNETLFYLWDFGGQEKYREEYLKNLDSHLSGIDKLFYVIDVQDKERFDIALDYLDKICRVLEKIEEQFEFNIFLHKYDPNILDIDPSINEVLSKDLIPKIRNLIPSTLTHQIYKTSIFTMFAKELVI